MIVRTARSLRRNGGYWPSMTPMVDVVLVILIFFMASAALLGPEWFLQIRAVAPEPAEAEVDPFALAMPVFIVNLHQDASGRTLASGVGLHGADLHALGEALEALLAEAGTEAVQVVLEPRRDVPYEEVVRAADIATRAGVTRLGVR